MRCATFNPWNPNHNGTQPWEHNDNPDAGRSGQILRALLLIWSHLGSQSGQILPYLADSHPGGTNIGNFEFLMNPSPRSTWSRFFCFNPPYIWFGLGRNLESKFQPSQIMSYLATNHVERWKEDSAFRYFRPPQFSSNVTTRAAAYQIASWKFQVFCLHYLDKFNP